jgi:hypothetical protein
MGRVKSWRSGEVALSPASPGRRGYPIGAPTPTERSGGNGVHINILKIGKTLLHKIPPNLPLLKGGIIPLFGKEGRGEIF